MVKDVSAENKLMAVANTPAELIRSAVTSGADLDKLEKLLMLQERWEANEARKAYHKAMTAFKANPPSIEKDKKVAFGSTRYNHASLSNVTKKVGDELSKHGLSASWTVTQNGTVSVTCRITHVMGHSEETTISAQSDTSGSKNAIQSIGSTITYLERYTLLALAGLATHEMDNDGKGTELISEDEAKTILDSLNAIGASVEKFLEYMHLEKIADMSKTDLKKAQSAIETAKKTKAKTAESESKK